MRATTQFTATLALVIGGAALFAPAVVAAPAIPPSSTAAEPTVTNPVDEAFIAVNSVPIAGTKTAGSSIQIPGVSGCSIPANAEETWSCTAVGLPNGPDFAIAPVQTLGGVPTTIDEPVRLNVLGPPTMNGGATVLTTGIVSGMAYPGSTIILGIGALEATCPAPARDDGYWSCNLPVGSGTYQVQAAQTISTIGTPPHNVSSATTHRTVTVDKDAPASPVVSTPRNNQRVPSQPTTFAGSGESGGRIDVYVDNKIVCSTVVSGGNWSCRAAGIPNGRHAVRAVLTDAAGNYGSPSSPIGVYFGPQDVVPGPPAGEEPTPGSTPTSPPLLPPDWPPLFPQPDGSGPTLQEALTNWGTPTGFGSHLSSPSTTLANGSWQVGLVVAIGFIGLIALPLRVLIGTMRGRIRFPRINLTGRNRGRLVTAGTAEAPPVNPWLAALVPLAAATALVVFSGGLGGEVRYLRLGFAVGLGLGILNLMGVAVVARLASAWQHASGRLQILPVMLIGAAIATVVSRLTDLGPPFLIGVIAAIVFTGEVPVRRRAIVGLVELVALSLLAGASWLLHQAIGPVDGFWVSIPSEALAAICIAGFGSVIVLLLPVGMFPGRAILEWSPVAWVVSALVLVTLAVAVLLGDPIAPAPLVIGGVVSAVFTVIALASWAWARFVDPIPRERNQ